MDRKGTIFFIDTSKNKNGMYKYLKLQALDWTKNNERKNNMDTNIQKIHNFLQANAQALKKRHETAESMGGYASTKGEKQSLDRAIAEPTEDNIKYAMSQSGWIELCKGRVEESQYILEQFWKIISKE
jgi:hypothetical protein